MKKTAFSLIAILALGHFTYAGGDITPVEPVVGTPVVEETSGWQNELTIYGWLPTINMDTRWGSGSSDTSDMMPDIIDNLKMVFIGTYAARYDKWSFVADVMYIDLGDSETGTHTFPGGETVEATVEMDIKSLLVSTGVGYNIVQTDNNILDVVAGVRYMDLEVDLSSDLPRHPGKSASEDILDGIIGLRGAYNFNENWYMPYYADIGTGDSELTYQLFAGVGYRYDWGDVKLGYRYIGYEMDDDKIIDNLDLSGAVLGVSFKF
ncbi:hypothetical protein ACLHDG_05285 [Sulfurovum sp. CS9]|uniref:hypothetical protein n=1 Tax=Sulfurovum sp. CS9 TaxID=3391146 RepID=UPI0039EBAE28